MSGLKRLPKHWHSDVAGRPRPVLDVGGTTGGEFHNVIDVPRPGELGTKAEFAEARATEADDKGRERIK